MVHMEELGLFYDTTNIAPKPCMPPAGKFNMDSIRQSAVILSQLDQAIIMLCFGRQNGAVEVAAKKLTFCL